MTIEDELSRFLKCIGEPTRLRILKLLTSGEKCVCEITGSLDREQSSISHHLTALKKCNIVTSRQEAKNIYYKLTNPRLALFVLTGESIVKDLPLCQVGKPLVRENSG
jgi:ArsR family transcriptional regulator